MAIIKLDVLGSVNIGNYAVSTNKYLVVTGEATDEKISRISEVLNVKPIKVVIRDCRITAPFFVGNKNGLLVSSFVDEETVQTIKEELRAEGVEVDVVDVKYTAIGNLVLANDHGAVASPLLPQKIHEEVSEALDVEVGVETIGKALYIGSLGVVNNYGGLVSPFAGADEIKILEDVLNVEVIRGTINSGIQFIPSGLIANDHGAVVGKITDGSELMRISQALKVI
ncbi:MAG: translation initiation factor IF-6 [Candidatus Geothermarchaeales archaeon]